MMIEKVDTERIRYAADRIKTVKGDLTSKFDALNGPVVRMFQNWNSSGGTAAEKIYRGLVKNQQPLSDVFSNYEKALREVSAVNLESAEEENKKLVEMFK